MTDIPQEWIKTYVDQLLNFASDLPENSAMRASALLRAETIMDLVEAWRKKGTVTHEDDHRKAEPSRHRQSLP